MDSQRQLINYQNSECIDENDKYNQQNNQYNQYNNQYNQYNGCNEYQDYSYQYPGNEEDLVPDLISSYSASMKEYQVLPSSTLFNDLCKNFEKVKQTTTLNLGWCLLLLRQFKWDEQKLDQYFQNIQMYKKKIQFSDSYSDPKILNSLDGTCNVCCSENIRLYKNICGHGFCRQCWKNHLETNIKTSNPFMKCMECNCPILNQTVLIFLEQFYPDKSTLIQTYKKRICEDISSGHRSYHFCTGADCGNCIKVYNLNLKCVKCTCGKVFCPKCNSDDHSPCTCEEKKSWMENVLKQEADAKWMAIYTKICPWCKRSVERSAGCNFMACLCGKSFCYLCSRPWQPDHKDHFKCHIFKKSDSEVINREKEILQKMNFFTQRYLEIQAIGINNKKIDTFQYRKLLFETLKIELCNSEFIESAYKFSIECCQFLKWIYAYSFYAKWKDANTEERFKFDQGQFQRFKQNLFKMLSVDLRIFLSEVQKYKNQGKINYQKEQHFNDQFINLKKTIINYYTMAKKYKEKFLEQIQSRPEEELILKKNISNNFDRDKKINKQKQPNRVTTRSSYKKNQEKKKNALTTLTGWFSKEL